MAVEKILLDYVEYVRFKSLEHKYHELKSKYDIMQVELEKKNETSHEQKGEGESAQLQKDILTRDNGVLNENTQVILPIETVPSNDANENGLAEGHSSTSEEENMDVEEAAIEKEPTVQEADNILWYYVGIPPCCK